MTLGRDVAGPDWDGLHITQQPRVPVDQGPKSFLKRYHVGLDLCPGECVRTDGVNYLKRYLPQNDGAVSRSLTVDVLPLEDPSKGDAAKHWMWMTVNYFCHGPEVLQGPGRLFKQA